VKELTFWQAYRKAASITLRALLFVCGLAAIGWIAAELLTSGHWVLTALLLLGFVAVGIGFEARSLQRWSR
jgi:F0F1-type ATP synthase assembly protein I